MATGKQGALCCSAIQSTDGAKEGTNWPCHVPNQCSSTLSREGQNRARGRQLALSPSMSTR